MPTDVGERDEVAAFSGAAIERFGRIDTWVNNAGTSIDGPYQDIPVTDQEKLFKTNFQGVVHGSMVALEAMKAQGGALINLGSVMLACLLGATHHRPCVKRRTVDCRDGAHTACMRIATFNVNGTISRLPVLVRWLERDRGD